MEKNLKKTFASRCFWDKKKGKYWIDAVLSNIVTT
jgi:hypothetical protein